MMLASRRRFPRSVYGTGSDPDPRFSLANERTYLAWIRTTLALLAAGVALEALEVPPSAGFRLASALTFVVLAVLAALQAWIGWARTERALREARSLPAPSLGVVITGGVIAACVMLGLGFVL
jgi:putative membrane protein